MKVLLINGSPDPKGCISTALKEAAKILNAEGIETEEVFVGDKAIRGCIACRRCHETGKCVFNDLVNDLADICVLFAELIRAGFDIDLCPLFKSLLADFKLPERGIRFKNGFLLFCEKEGKSE